MGGRGRGRGAGLNDSTTVYHSGLMSHESRSLCTAVFLKVGSPDPRGSAAHCQGVREELVTT